MLLEIFADSIIKDFHLFISTNSLLNYNYCYSKTFGLNSEPPRFKNFRQIQEWKHNLNVNVNEFELELSNNIMLSTFFGGDLFIKNLDLDTYHKINSYLGKPFLDECVYRHDINGNYSILESSVIHIDTYLEANCLQILDFQDF